MVRSGLYPPYKIRSLTRYDRARPDCSVKNTLTNGSHGNGARAFFAFLDLKLDPVTFVQDLETGADNSRMMDEEICSIIMRKKTKTFFLIEPFNCTFRHKKTPNK